MHRDLKEQNVLVATLPTSETRGKFKVSDFGLACESARHMVGETCRTNERTDIVAMTSFAPKPLPPQDEATPASEDQAETW